MLLGWLALWFVAAALASLFRYSVDDAFGLMTLAGWVVLGGSFAAILTASVTRAAKRRGEGPSVLVVLAVVAAGLPFLAVDTKPLARQFRFRMHRAEYEAVVRDVLDGMTPRRGSDRFTVEPGPPVRVAFHWPGGILDNWMGVVYDPSGLVLKVRGRRLTNRDDPDPEVKKARGLFGGTLYHSEPLGGDWYFCRFT